MLGRIMVKDHHYEPVIRWYRYVDENLATPTIQLYSFRVVKKTERGVWIDYSGTHTWVSGSSRKRFAYPTKALAFEAFVARKNSHMKHIQDTKRHLDHILHLIRTQKSELLKKDFITTEIPFI